MMIIDRCGLAAVVVAFALLLLPRIATAGGSLPPPPETSVDPAVAPGGNYTVMWTDTSNPDSLKTVYLQESFNGGAWQTTLIAAGEYSRTFTGKPPGSYTYRTEAHTMIGISHSTEATVTVPVSYDVGVIPGGTVCGGAAPIEIRMDDEDDVIEGFGHPNSYTSGWTGGIYVDGNWNTHFLFCKVDGTQFKPLTNIADQASEYAVIKLGDECPKDSVEFGRYFDNEDGHYTWYGKYESNKNWNTGNIAPNWQDPDGTMLRFCLFRYGPETLLTGDGYTENISWPDLGFSYGVFAGWGFSAIVTGVVHTDDEDSNDTTSYFDIPSWLDASSVYRIVVGHPYYGGNTDLYTAQVRYQ